MPRPADPAFLAALEAESVRLFYTVELELDDSTVRWWSGTQDMEIDGNLYQGAGMVLDVSPARETSQIAARGVNIEISGIPPGELAIALNEEYKGRDASIHLGVLEADGTPRRDLLYKGTMDAMVISEGSEVSSMNLSVESHLVRLTRTSNARYTDAYQKERHPMDRGLEFVVGLNNTQILWGAKGPSVINPEVSKAIEEYR